MNYELLERRVEKTKLQAILKASDLNLKDLFGRFAASGYKIYLNPSVEEFETKIRIGERVVLLLPDLMDGYLSIAREKRLQAIVLTLSKVATSKFRPYIFSEVE